MGRGAAGEASTLTVGQVAGAHGVKGWVKVISHTEPREAILDYDSWLLGESSEPIALLDGSRHGKSVIARLEGVNDRNAAEALRGHDIRIDRGQLPDVGENQFYWADLIGLEVLLGNGDSLGRVEQMMATGANDVLVVEGDRQRLIPFLMDSTVLKVDLEAGKITVDWDPEF